MPRLLAHEFGHLLGSDHDGDVARSVDVIIDTIAIAIAIAIAWSCLMIFGFRGMHSIYKNQPRVPCPSGQSLMSPTVG